MVKPATTACPYWGKIDIEFAEGEMMQSLKISDQTYDFADLMASAPGGSSGADLALSANQIDALEASLDAALDSAPAPSATMEASFAETVDIALDIDDVFDGDAIA